MCILLVLAASTLVPTAALAQDKKKTVVPVPVVELKRKDPVTFEKDIEPLFAKRCITCHSGSIKEGRFDLSTYEALMKGGRRGTPVIPGKGADSLLYKSCARTQKPFMPPPKEEEPVTPEELALIKLWIDQGAKAPTGMRERPKILVGLPPANVQPVRAVAVSPDKSIIAAGRGNQIHVYDAAKGDHLRTLIDPKLKTPDGKVVKVAHLSLVEAMAFAPDGKYLVSGSFQEIAIWDAKTGQQIHKLGGFAHAIVALTFSLDGKLLAVGGGPPTEDGEIKIFEVGSWKMVADIKNAHSDTVYGLAFSPDAKMLATCAADKFVKVFALPTGKFAKSFEGHTHHVLDVGWMADGKLLASAGADNTVKIWDYEKGEQLRTIPAHAKQVTRLLFIGKKPEFVTCGGDAQVKFFNAQNGAALRTFGGNTDFIYAIGISPDGTLLAAGGQEGIVRVYNGTTGQLVRSLVPGK